MSIQAVADIDLVQELEAFWNDIAGHFNREERDGAGRLLWQMIDTYQDHPLPANSNIIELLCLFRLIGWQLHDPDAVLAIDAMIDPFLGSGLIHYRKEDDIALRGAANDVLSAHSADAPDTHERLSTFMATFSDERYLFLYAADVFKAIRSICVDMNEPTFVETCDSILLTLHAQNKKADVLRKCMPKVDLDAIDYPTTVSIETYSKCNATCGFCPYPEMDKNGQRVGTKMSEELFRKVISDLSDIPKDHAFSINLSRVNEPLLDKRIFDFIDHIGEKLPQCTVGFPSNGSTLTKANIKKLSKRPNFNTLSISLNATEPERYKKIMGLDFERTTRNLDTLHAMHQAGEINWNIWLTAVVTSVDEINPEWCRERYPGFELRVYYATNWFGLTENTVADSRLTVGSCKDWYQIHLLADGNEALCCYDALGRFGEGNVKDAHILDIYNAPWRREARQKLAIRQSACTPECCKKCDYT